MVGFDGSQRRPRRHSGGQDARDRAAARATCQAQYAVELADRYLKTGKTRRAREAADGLFASIDPRQRLAAEQLQRWPRASSFVPQIRERPDDRQATMAAPASRHFATYVDRYATDGYGPQRDPAGDDRPGRPGRGSLRGRHQLPFVGKDVSHGGDRPGTGAQWAERHRDHARDLYPPLRQGFTNPDPGVRRLANEMCNEAAKMVRHFGADYVETVAGPGRLGLPASKSTTRRCGPRRSRASPSWPPRTPT
ncbi:hypothetical protein ACRAWD_23145 [Caulobacter segnis]